MSSLGSSILIVGHPQPEGQTIGADFANNHQDAEQFIQNEKYNVIAFSNIESKKGSFKKFLEKILELQPRAQKVLVNFDLSFEELKTLTNSSGVFKILNAFDEPHFQQSLQEALEEYSQLDQNQQLIQLINEQNERLKKLSVDLEKRVEKRQKYLTNARKKLLISNERIEALHKALVAIHHASSISDLEVLVNDALKSTLSLSWTRILFEWQNVLSRQNLFQQNTFEIFSAPIIRDKEFVAQIYFAREKSRPFKKDEHGFLMQVADSITLAIDRLYRFEEAQTLKQQWEATFDAITTPVSLINADYDIVRCNHAFARQAGKPLPSLIGQKCFKALFNRSKPCSLCHIGSSFRLTPQKTGNQETITFEVATQRLDNDESQQELYVTLYRNISEQLKLQRHVLESAKMAEIGTIGSSIAHELNNPLGGMISFLQLIKADLKGDEPFSNDITEMQNGASKCKDIVQNLLNFSRLPSIDQQEKLNFIDAIQRAVKITELQTKSKGIEIKLETPKEDLFIEGQFHLLTQAIRHLLQFSISAISEAMKKQINFVGLISIWIEIKNDTFIFYIETNTSFPKQNKNRQNKNTAQGPENLSFGPGLDLSITDQIIVEHSGTLEIISQFDNSFLAKVTLPRLLT